MLNFTLNFGTEIELLSFNINIMSDIDVTYLSHIGQRCWSLSLLHIPFHRMVTQDSQYEWADSKKIT